MLFPSHGSGKWCGKCLCVACNYGISPGSVYPCVHTLLAKWVPRTERGFLTTGIYSGAQFGTAVILVSSGFIFESSMGWPGLFYISGGLNVAWALLFFWQGANEPATATRISQTEREYIESLTGSNSSSQVGGKKEFKVYCYSRNLFFSSPCQCRGDRSSLHLPSMVSWPPTAASPGDSTPCSPRCPRT